MNEHFELLIHAQQCRADCAKRRVCAAMQAHLQHYVRCKVRGCKYLNCFNSRLLLTHYSNCRTKYCKICPIRSSPQFDLCGLLRMLFGFGRTETSAQATTALLTEEERQSITVPEAIDALMGVLPDPNDEEDIKLTNILHDLADQHQHLHKKLAATQETIEKVVKFRHKRQDAKNFASTNIPPVPRELYNASMRVMGQQQLIIQQPTEGGQLEIEQSTPEEPQFCDVIEVTDESDSYCEYQSTGDQSDVEGFEEYEESSRETPDVDSRLGEEVPQASSETQRPVNGTVDKAAGPVQHDKSSDSEEWDVLQQGGNTSRRSSEDSIVML